MLVPLYSRINGELNPDVCFGYHCINDTEYRHPEPHTHDFDEYIVWMGGNAEDVFDFNAEIELFLGEEGEKHIIDKATVLYIPAGLVHCPINIKKVSKPILYNVIAFHPSYYNSAATNQEIFVRKGELKKLIADIKSAVDEAPPTRAEYLKAFLKELESNKETT